MTKALAPIAVLVTAGLAIAGCGSSESGSTGAGGNGSSGGSTSTTKPASTVPAASTGVVVSVTTTPKLGKTIVSPEGFTLYGFHKDRGTTSACYGDCAKVWPPLLTEGKPRAGEGAVASKLGTTRRKDGTVQATYAGHPLYTYAADKKPGDTTGNDTSSFGAQWYALSPR